MVLKLSAVSVKSFKTRSVIYLSDPVATLLTTFIVLLSDKVSSLNSSSSYDMIYGVNISNLWCGHYFSTVTQQYIPVLQVLVKYVFSTYLYGKYSRSTSRSSSGNTRIVISVSFTYPSLIATHIVWLSKISYSLIP